MRLRNITGSREVIAESPYVVPEDTLEACPGTWHEIFGNDHPIHIEIGMGKGRFLNTLAKQNPQINYVGIEKYSSVLLRAIQKMEEAPLPNVHFICMDADELPEVEDDEEDNVSDVTGYDEAEEDKEEVQPILEEPKKEKAIEEEDEEEIDDDEYDDDDYDDID